MLMKGIAYTISWLDEKDVYIGFNGAFALSGDYDATMYIYPHNTCSSSKHSKKLENPNAAFHSRFSLGLLYSYKPVCYKCMVGGSSGGKAATTSLGGLEIVLGQ